MRCIHQKQAHQQPTPNQVRTKRVMSLCPDCFDLDVNGDCLANSRHAFRRLREHQIEVAPLQQVCRYRQSEEHTSELQSQSNLVCRLLLEKKKRPSGRETLSFICLAWPMR